MRRIKRTSPWSVERLECRVLLSFELVTDLRPGPDFDSDPHGLVTVGDKVYFAAEIFTNQSHTRVWSTDGTAANTLDLAGADSGTHWRYGGPVVAGGKVLFQGYVGTTPSVWASDGTPAGTTRLAVESGGWNNNTETNTWATALGDRFIFKGDTPATGWELFSSDGTDANTFPLTGPAGGGHAGVHAVLGAHNGLAYFVDGQNKLGVTDGTSHGTRLIADLNAGGGTVRDVYLTPAGDKVFFHVPTGQGLKLWQSDGTAAGTGPVPTSLKVLPGPMAELGGLLYFIGASTSNGDPAQLYRTDGTLAGTHHVGTLNIDMSRGGPRVEFRRAGDFIWMDLGSGIWRTDGTAAGTRQVLPGRSGGEFMFDGRRLWLKNVDYVVDMADPTQVRATGLPRADTFGSLAVLGSHVYFPHKGELHRAAVPTQYLPNLDVRVFHDANGNGVQDGGEGAYPFPSNMQIWADLNDDGQQTGNEPGGQLAADGTARLIGVPDGQPVVVRFVDNAARFTTPSAVTVTVIGGQAPPAVVVGANRNNRVSGSVYDDRNGNAARDAGEPGVAGRRVYVDLDEDNAFDAGEPSTLTDAQGVYRFETVPGEKYVRAELPSGWRATENPHGFRHSNYTGARDVTYGPFGQTTLPLPGGVSGQVFLDYDGDGTRAANEPLAAVPLTVYLDADGDGVLDAGEPSRAATTGSVEFTNVQPGQYALRVVAPAGWTQGAAPAVTVASGVTGGATAAISPTNEPGSISGAFYEDDDLDGVRGAGEPGQPGGHAYLDHDGDGVRDAGEPVAVPDLSGAYRFPGLAAGTYRVVAVPPSGRSAVEPRFPSARSVTFDGTTPVTDADFGSVASSRVARVTGRVYHDVNGNTVYDPGTDTPIPNVVVTATNFPPVVTDADGVYELRLPATTVTVRVTTPAGWTPPSPSFANVSGIPFQTTAGPVFRLAPTASAQLPAAVSGTVFNDLDADGVRDPLEPGAPASHPNSLPDITAYADLDRDGAFDAGEPSSRLDEGGRYVIGNVPPGTFDVRLSLRGGYAQTAPAGAAGHAYTLAPGQRGAGADFGVSHRPATARGEVWLDQDHDGARGPGDGLAAGFVVRLDLDNDGVFGESGEPTATSDLLGQFTFTNLSPGTYRIALAAQTNYQQVQPAAGTSLTFGVAAREVTDGLVLGVARVGVSLGGKVFDDPDRNGVQGPSEGGLGGWKVRVERAQDPTQFWQATANFQGQWSLEGLAAGSYRVTLINASPATSDVVTPGSGEYLITPGPGEVVQNLNFGLAAKPYNATGQIFNDANANGQLEAGEGGWAGLTVYRDVNDNRRLDAGEPTQQTGADGRFTFAGVMPNSDSGKYRAVAPPNAVRTFPYGEQYDYMQPTNVVPGSTVDVGRLGFYAPAAHFISGTAYLDVNANGHRDAGEPPIQGRTIGYDVDSDGHLDTSDHFAVTNADGWYAFTRFDPRARYNLRDMLPPAWVGTEPANGGWRYVTGGHPTETYTGVDFGSVPFAAMGHLYNDHDGDATRDPGEETLVGRTVYADVNGNGRLDPGEPSATSDGNGMYGLFVPAAGTYRVRQVLPDGWSQSYPIAGAAHQPSLTPGTTVGQLDFGTQAMPAWLAASAGAAWNPATRTLTVTGAATITANPGGDAPIVTADGAAAVLTIHPAPGTRVNLGGLRLANGARAVLQSGGPPRVLVIADGAGFSLDATSTLDLADNALVIRNAGASAAAAQHASVNALVRAALNGFAWDGPGVTSSLAAADVAGGTPSTLGILLNNDGSGGPLFYGAGTGSATFLGASVDANTVTVRFTRLGDGDLNATVDSVDFALFQAGHTGAAPFVGFAFGDYDLNGVTDSVDFGLFQAGYQAGTGSASAAEDDDDDDDDDDEKLPVPGTSLAD